MKYKLLENIIPSDIIEYLQSYTLKIKERIKLHEGKYKSNDYCIYWKGLDIESSCNVSSK